MLGVTTPPPLRPRAATGRASSAVPGAGERAGPRGTPANWRSEAVGPARGGGGRRGRAGPGGARRCRASGAGGGGIPLLALCGGEGGEFSRGRGSGGTQGSWGEGDAVPGEAPWLEAGVGLLQAPAAPAQPL